jgi:membrane-bound lytic murein transglycosylase B
MRRLAVALVAAAALAGCSAEPGRAGDPAPGTAAPAATSSTTAAGGPVLARPGQRPVAAQDPDGLATQLATALDVLAQPGRPIEEVVSAGHLQQVAVTALASRPDWDAAVAERLPPPQRLAVATDVGAVRELQALVRRPRSTLPAWRIERPPAAEDLRAWYAEAEAATGVPWSLLAAVHLVETRMSRIDGDSSAGAQGPMQFLPSTWTEYGAGGDIHDDRDAILGAARFLAASGAREDPYRALLRYNPTAHYARAVAAFAGRMATDERAFAGYHGWEVHYRTTLGDVWLRAGYEADEERPVAPDDLR